MQNMDSHFWKMLRSLLPGVTTDKAQAMVQWTIGLGTSLVLAGCMTNDPRREADLAWDGKTVFARPDDCGQLYSDTDQRIWHELRNPNTNDASRKQLLAGLSSSIGVQLAQKDSPTARCWTTSYENHQDLPKATPSADAGTEQPPGYDLLIAEFDDQGERTDVSRGRVSFDKSEVALIEGQLGAILDQEVKKGGGINLVLLTHGWHGSAAADNDYAALFKAILQQITYLEKTSRRSTCRSLHEELTRTIEGSDREKLESQVDEHECPSPESGVGGASFAERRTVGIEIAWRGDSETIPLLTWANFWDRKNAIETLSKGGVHDLFARIHKFYVANSCHGQTSGRTAAGRPCDRVHLLTVGHSFGALIDFQTLNNDISSGLLGDQRGRAYGFGDITVLLNPAFEGERVSTLFDAATHRSAYPNEIVAADPVQPAQPADRAHWPPGAQMPTVVTLQSRGDWATQFLFPAARFFTSPFENTPGAHEYSRGLTAVGWVRDYQTHDLSLISPGGKDTCDDSGPHPAWFCPFDLAHEDSNPLPLNLHWAGSPTLPAYLPLWTVAVDTSIMADHDDIWNPSIIRFVARIFRTAYDQEDRINDAYRQRAKQTPGAETSPASRIRN